MATIPFPKPLPIPQIQAAPGGPSYTDIYNETVGAAPDPAELDPLLAEALTLAQGLETEVLSGVLDSSISLGSSIADVVDPTAYDGHMANYVAAMPDGTQALADLGNQTVPALLQLPISASFNGALGAPPTQQGVNLGTVPLGSAPLTIQLGSYAIIHDQDRGYITASLADGNPAIFRVVQTSTYNAASRNGLVSYALVVNPQLAGTWVAQLDIVGGAGAAGSIITYTITVTP